MQQKVKPLGCRLRPISWLRTSMHMLRCCETHRSLAQIRDKYDAAGRFVQFELQSVSACGAGLSTTIDARNLVPQLSLDQPGKVPNSYANAAKEARVALSEVRAALPGVPSSLAGTSVPMFRKVHNDGHPDEDARAATRVSASSPVVPPEVAHPVQDQNKESLRPSVRFSSRHGS